MDKNKLIDKFIEEIKEYNLEDKLENYIIENENIVREILSEFLSKHESDIYEYQKDEKIIDEIDKTFRNIYDDVSLNNFNKNHVENVKNIFDDRIGKLAKDTLTKIIKSVDFI